MVAPPLAWGNSLWASWLGGPSENGGAQQLPWYPALATCPGQQKPCVGEATWNAFKALQKLVAGAQCSLCDTYVFSKLGRPRQQFSSFLNLPPLLSDGTLAHAPMNHVMCDWWDIFCPFGSQTVSNYMQTKVASAISRTPSPKGPVIYVNPVSVCTAGTSPGTLLNEAMLFHEALHGFTGLYDTDLANKLGVSTSDYNTYGSTSITYYLESNVFGAALHYFDPGGNAVLVCQN